MPPTRPKGIPPRAPSGSNDGPNWSAFAVLVFAVTLEGSMVIMLFGAYSETMGMMSDVYLCDLPAVGKIFCALDDEMTVSHLLAFLLAVFSIAVPIGIWSIVISERIYEDPQAWLVKPTNRAYAIVAVVLYALVFTLETVNLYTLIARETIGGPFNTRQANPLMSFLSDNQGLGIFVAALVAIVNTVLALMTVRAVHSLKNSL